MKFFADTADVQSISGLIELGLLDGVTTNPSLINKSGRNFRDVIVEICSLVTGPVSAEVLATDAAEMIKEGHVLSDLAENVVVKLPLTLDGLKACRALSTEGISTNVTLCFSVNQALLAAKAGATYISPFIGRLDDINVDGMQLIRDIRTVYDNFDFGTELLAASIRTPLHVEECAKIGADIVTVPPNVIESLAEHVLTQKGLAAFLSDAKAASITI